MSDESSRSPYLDRLYQDYLHQESTADFIRAVASSYTLGTLARLVRCVGPVSRRAAVLAIGFLGEYEQNAVLGCALTDSDRAVRMLADHGIRGLWFRCGEAAQRRELSIVARLNDDLRFGDAIRRGTRLIDAAPWIPESWNQRGFALYQTRQFDEAANDYHQTLELNAYHFVAAVGMGHCYLEMEDRSAALDCFRRALKLNPDMEGVRAQVQYLERSL